MPPVLCESLERVTERSGWIGIGERERVMHMYSVVVYSITKPIGGKRRECGITGVRQKKMHYILLTCNRTIRFGDSVISDKNKSGFKNRETRCFQIATVIYI